MAEKKQRLISKGRYLDGLRCPRLIWFKINQKDAIPKIDPSTKLRFDNGHEIGRLAHKLFKDAIEIDWDPNAGTVNEKSLKALKTGKTLYEAGFASIDTYSIADILIPVEGKEGVYDLIEVKMATEVKDYYKTDVAFQKYNFEKNGLKIRKCYLMFVNNEYLYEGGEIDVNKYFKQEDITDDVNNILPQIAGNLEKMQTTISQIDAPPIKFGDNCDTPFDCPLREECFSVVPRGSVMELAGAFWKDRYNMWNKGQKMIVDLSMPAHPEKKNDIKKKTVYTALKENKVQFDREKLREFLEKIEYPVYYLDFETVQLPVPRYKNTHPYAQIPFQFSLHIQKEKGGKLEHHMFLAPDASDPRPEFMAKLSALIQKKGTILAFNDSFEKGKLKGCAEELPEYMEWVNRILPWFVDLAGPFRVFDYYHPDQAGSYSLKYVYPALTGHSYEGLEIAEGGMAMAEFTRVTYYDVKEEDRAKVRRDLLKYCEQDTIAMVEILKVLYEEMAK